MKVSVLGLGAMGSGIARNALRIDPSLLVWNRSAAKSAPLVAAGAHAAQSPKAAALERDIVLSMLADDSALEAVLEGPDGLLAGLAPGALHVSMSTIAPATAERLGERHRERGQRFIAAPVFGRPDAAAAAKLFIVAAGDPAECERARPLLEALGQRVFLVGERPAAANVVKLCGNFMILSAVEAFAEAMALARKSGVPAAQLVEVLTGSLFDCIAYRGYGSTLAQERFRPAGFAAPLGLKDMRLVAQAAEAQRVPMPLVGLLRDHLLETIALEGEDIDWSAIGRTIARHGGL